MFTLIDICYMLFDHIETFILIILSMSVWRVLKQNEQIKREKQIVDDNMKEQQDKYELVLFRAMKENQQLRNNTRELLNDVRAERRKIAELNTMILSIEQERGSIRRERIRSEQQNSSRESNGNAKGKTSGNARSETAGNIKRNSGRRGDEGDNDIDFDTVNKVVQTMAGVAIVAVEIFRLQEII